MCGFLVTFDPHGLSNADFSAALDTLQHRGPDDRRMYQDGPLRMGFQRLAILDRSPAGQQPLCLDEGETVLVYNGEIYSFQDHRRHLESHGVEFHSSGDTEVVARMLQRYGAEALPSFNGMFAFCTYFPRQHKLLLGRDRLGIKPLYIFCDGTHFAAASELKALLRLPFILPTLNKQALLEFFTFGYTLGPQSIFRHISCLAPGTYAEVQIDPVTAQLSLSERRYWQLPQEGQERLAPVALRELVTDAVKLRTVADVPLLLFLSGGIDSTIVTTCLGRVQDRKPMTFTLGFAGTNDETAAAAASATVLGTDHHSGCLSPAHDDILKTFIETYDEPFGDDSALAMLLLCREARQLATVALSGDGGDELFAGYDRYQKTVRLQSWLGMIPVSLAGLLGRAVTQSTGIWSRWNRLAWWFQHSPRLHYLDQVCKVHPRHNMLPLDALADWVIDAPGSAADWRQRLEWMQRWDVHNYLVGDILTKVDRASMRWSLEVRVPLLDHRIVETAFRVPRDQLWHNGVRKCLLREAFGRDLPSHIDGNPKRGFGLPIAEWLAGPWRDNVLAAFDQHRTSPHRIFTDELLSLLRTAFEQGIPEANKAAWLVFVFEQWHARWGTVQ